MATQQLFSPQFPSPALAPDLLRQQYQTQMAQQYANQLLQDGGQMPQGQMVSGHYVAPSPTQYLAQGLKSYIGSKLASSIPDRLANMQRTQQAYGASLFGLTPPQQLGAALQSGQASADSPSTSTAQAFPVGPSGSPQQPPAQPMAAQPTRSSPQALGAALRPQMPLLPGRTPEQSFQAFSLLGPAEYMKQVVSQGTPTDVVKNMVAAGIDPNSPQGRTYLSMVLQKNASNMVNVRPGGTVFDANAGQPLYHAPGTNGVQVAETPRGPVMYNVPGSTGAISAASTAQAAGPATYRTQTVNNLDGSNYLSTDRAIGDQIQNQPAPLRNNNPGALMPGGKLASYPTMEAGLQALDANLASYGKQGVNTVSGVISKWAPPNENDTQAYIKDVATRLGVDPNQQIDLSRPLVRHALGTAIALHESGPGAVFGAAGPAPQQGVQRGIPVQGEGTIAANQELGKDQAKELIASRTGAINATNELTTIAAERKALSSGTFGGTGAQARLNAVKFLQGWVPGLDKFDASKVTNTDYVVSMLGNAMLANIKKLGTQPTDPDREALEAIVGTIGKDPNALNRLIDFQEMMANRAIQRHNQLVDQARSGGIQTAFDMSVSPQTGMPREQEPPGANPPPTGFKIVGVH